MPKKNKSSLGKALQNQQSRRT